MSEKNSLEIELSYIFEKKLENWSNIFIGPLVNEIFKYFVDIFSNGAEKVKELKTTKPNSSGETDRIIVEFLELVNPKKIKIVPSLDLKKIISNVQKKLPKGNSFEAILNLILKLNFKSQMTVSVSHSADKKTYINYVRDEDFVLMILMKVTRNVVLKFPHVFNNNEAPFKKSQNNLEAFRLISENIQNSFIELVPIGDIFQKPVKRLNPLKNDIEEEENKTKKFINKQLDENAKEFIMTRTKDIAMASKMEKKASIESEKSIIEMKKVQEQSLKMQEQSEKLIQKMEELSKNISFAKINSNLPPVENPIPVAVHIPIKENHITIPNNVTIPQKPLEVKSIVPTNNNKKMTTTPPVLNILPLQKDAIQFQQSLKPNQLANVPNTINPKETILQYTTLEKPVKKPSLLNTQKIVGKDDNSIKIVNDKIEDLSRNKIQKLPSSNSQNLDEDDDDDDSEGDIYDENLEGAEEDIDSDEEDDTLSSVSQHVQKEQQNQ